VDMDDSTDLGFGAAFTGVQARVPTADAVAEAFLGLTQEPESALDEYFPKNLVRYLCACEEGLLALAMGALATY
jgi:hypothetical protein